MKVTQAEKILGSSLLRQVQRRLPEGGRLTIPARYPKRTKPVNPNPEKTDRNREVCLLVLVAGEKKKDVAARFGISAGRVTAILKGSDRWLS